MNRWSVVYVLRIIIWSFTVSLCITYERLINRVTAGKRRWKPVQRFWYLIFDMTNYAIWWLYTSSILIVIFICTYISAQTRHILPMGIKLFSRKIDSEENEKNSCKKNIIMYWMNCAYCKNIIKTNRSWTVACYACRKRCL